MLMNDLYTFSTIASAPGLIRGLVTFNPAHAVFSGHFPGRPVVPGVCLIQAVKEVMEIQLGRPVMLSEALNVKFLQVIDPRSCPVISLEINYGTGEDGRLKVDAFYHEGQTVFVKFKCFFI